MYNLHIPSIFFPYLEAHAGVVVLDLLLRAVGGVEDLVSFWQSGVQVVPGHVRDDRSEVAASLGACSHKHERGVCQELALEKDKSFF